MNKKLNMPKKSSLILSFIFLLILITSLTFNVVKYNSERVVEVTTEKVIDKKEEIEKLKEELIKSESTIKKLEKEIKELQNSNGNIKELEDKILDKNILILQLKSRNNGLLQELKLCVEETHKEQERYSLGGTTHS